ncbi:hypothetical protein DAETH_29600 [Deinococcus aetherius]|uniref:Uncharacterized protein n=1 Tax=Deinococcus aetherius TaxID=200252 RepID=A0ABN6RHY1_9DEIO|nr:hypothetical protein [Deinococcus aetherius]BDP42991.1 hypothetical protein DAETH_29600 [Deinococcus aetherius]
MSRNSGRLAWFWRFLAWVGDLGPPPRPAPVAPRRDDDDEGPGVPVPAGPRLPRDGARARPPHERDRVAEQV